MNRRISHPLRPLTRILRKEVGNYNVTKGVPSTVYEVTKTNRQTDNPEEQLLQSQIKMLRKIKYPVQGQENIRSDLNAASIFPCIW